MDIFQWLVPRMFAQGIFGMMYREHLFGVQIFDSEWKIIRH